MAANQGTLVGAAIRPADDRDEFASVFANEGKGGYHTADNLEARNNIPEARREFGMICYVVEEEKEYRLTTNNSGIITDNDNWEEVGQDSHTHANKSILDGIDSDDIDNWDEAYDKAHTHSNKDILDELTQTDIENWNNKADIDDIDLSDYQEKLTAGDNITIEGNVISAAGEDIEEWLSNRPKVTKFGERPEILILDEGTAKMVEVSTEGIFTDIRSFSAFVGGAIEGGTNIFRATIRNVSGVSVNGLEVTVVLPESGDDITYEEPNISNPTTGTVTEVSREGNIYNYDITSLPAGKTIEISFPITWGVPGTFQASTTVKVIDPVVIDYATGDDYSSAFYRVSAKSEGEETEDCPLIEVTSNDIQVPVYSVSGNNNKIGDRIQVVSENDIILKTNIPVTFVGRYRTISGSSRNLISRVITGKIVKTHTYGEFSDESHQNIGVTYTPVSATELKISFDPTKEITGGLVELRAGGSCNPQYIYVDCKYETGEGLSGFSSEIINIVGHSDYIISSENSTNPQEFSFIDLDTGEQYDSVEFYHLNDVVEEHIILNIPSGVSKTIELETSDKVRLVSDLSGNITSSFDSTTGKTTLEIADTASSQDNFTSERVTFNFID